MVLEGFSNSVVAELYLNRASDVFGRQYERGLYGKRFWVLFEKMP